MRLIVAIALALVLAGVILAPLLAESSSVASLPLYAAFSWICHQRPQRAWTVGGFPLAVCVRCLGLYLGALAGATAGWRFDRRLFLASMAVLAAEWLVEAAGWAGPPALVRFSTGLAAGFFLVPAFWGNTERPLSVIYG
ncbi:MAG: DUF2085 domain-containing protein [Acidobacteria bacterium]|nr:DUF2085 domain-containing protein [Acidobacteriota bacterium]